MRASLLLSLFFLASCRPPEDTGPAGTPKVGEVASRNVPMDGSGGTGAGPGGGGAADDGNSMSKRGLGKEDFALIEAELRCVNTQFAADPAAKKQATDGIMARYGASDDWVERVRVHMESEPDVAARIDEMVARRMSQVCADGKLSPELLAAPAAAPAASGAESAVPAAAPVEAAPTPAGTP